MPFLTQFPGKEDEGDKGGCREAHAPPQSLADAHAREGLLKVRAKIGPLHKEEHRAHPQGDEGVPHALHEEGSQRLVKGEKAFSVLSHGRVADYVAQLGHLSGTRQHQVHRHADVVGVKGGDGRCGRIERLQQHFPSDTADVEDGDAEEHGQEDVLPPADHQGLRELRPVHGPEAEPDEETGHQRPESVAEDIFRFLVHTLQR